MSEPGFDVVVVGWDKEEDQYKSDHFHSDTPGNLKINLSEGAILTITEVITDTVTTYNPRSWHKVVSKMAHEH